VNVDPLRRYGRIMEVRRLSVNGDYRFQPDIIRGLFKCAIEVALENDVSFMLDQAFHFVVAPLAKPGFEPLHVGGRVVFEFGSATRLIAYNFLARQFANSLDEKSRHALRFAVSQCLRSRYRHRAVIRQACAAEQRRAPLLSPPISTSCACPATPRTGRMRPAAHARSRGRREGREGGCGRRAAEVQTARACGGGAAAARSFLASSATTVPAK
jgi:hypothetical protein